MATIKGWRNKFRSFYGNAGENLRKVISAEVSRSKDVILDLNRDQMLSGRDANGKLLTPGYLNDPYFQTANQAKSYYAYKQSIEEQNRGRMSQIGVEIFPLRPPNTPNLIVTGVKFMNFLFIKTAEDSYTIGSTGLISGDIEKKYGKVFGLAPLSVRYYYFGFTRMAIDRALKSAMRK